MREASFLRGRQLAVGGMVRGDPAVLFIGSHDDPEGDTATGLAVELHEGDLVTPGEEPNPGDGDAPPAYGAVDAVGQLVETIPWIHGRSVYRVSGRSAEEAWCRLPAPCRRVILPQGMMSFASNTAQWSTCQRMSTKSGPHSDHGGHDTFRHSYSKDKAQLVRRLSRMEGQVRGIARMIERDEYCIDILQQTAALRAAVDALSILVLEDHVQGCVRTAAERGEADKYVDEVIDVVRRTLGRPIRGGSRSA
jgi:CsoR family transcriptional regulator, copper-sensing transcriptional repressor